MKTLLHNALTLCGRCCRVALVCEVDNSNKLNVSELNLIIPGSVNICGLHRSPRINSQEVEGKSGLPGTWNICA